MKKNKTLKRFLAFLLCAAMVVTYMPSSVFTLADENGDNVAVEATAAEPAQEKKAEEPAPAAEPEAAKEAAPAPVEEPAPVAEPAPAEEAAPAEEPQPEATPEATEPAAEQTEAEPAEPKEEVVEEEAKDETKLNAEKLTFTGKANSVDVKVVAAPGTFPEGTTMKVTSVAKKEVKDAVEGAIDDVKDFRAVDITFYADGKEVQPKKDVAVKLTTAAFDTSNDLNVVHVEDSGAAAVMDLTKASDSMAQFKTDGFSVYVVVETGEDARLEVNFKNGENTIASTVVKQSDIDSGIFNQIVYDPGAGELGSGEVFRGWTTKADYTVDDIGSGMNIDDVRAAVKAKLNEGVTEADGKPATMDVYAMVFKAINITYKDEDGVVIKNEAVLIATGETGEISYEVSEPYVPKTSDQEFQGWYFTSSAAVKDADGNTIPAGSTIANESTVKISADLILTVKAPKGAWLIFKENGKGASYTPPQFLENEKPTKPTDPTRFGYTFGGWYTNEACTGDQFDFDQVLTETTRVYAKWTENATANYTVIIWRQKVSDAKDAADAAKTYDFAESVSLSGNVGETINTVTATGTGDNRYARVNGVNKQYTGFHLGRYDQDVTISVDGTSVVNVYYDRNLVTLTFQYRENNSWRTQETMTGLYGSTLEDNGYTWPTNRWWYDDYEQSWGNYSGAGTRTTFLDAFIISDGSSSQTFYGFSGSGSNTIRWYKQLANGNWPALNSPTNTATSSNGTFSISDKYNGYHAVSYSTNGGSSWTALGNKNADGYYATGISTRNGLWIRFAPDLYNIQFTDGVYVDGDGVAVEGYSSRGELRVEKDVPYASDISAYNKGGAKYYEPTFDGFVFEGWYLDDTCTQPCTFTTMPEGMQVYAKWVQKEYRVFLHPNVPTSDTTFSMGDQNTSFRVDYNGSISAIDARRDDYELVGWYTDENCTRAFNFDAYVLNDTTVTNSYDQTQPTETDLYGNPTEATNKDKVENRFWITKKLDLYAKWRSKLIGANGITVVYDAAEGSFEGGATTYTDPLTYKDQAKAVATTASISADSKKEFESWSIQKWNGSAFEDTGDTVLPGDSFEVLKSYTQQTENEGSTAEEPSYTYTFKLVAKYKPIEEETLTHIDWYANNKTNEVKSDDRLKMNQAIDIEPANTFSYEGYEFVGWSRWAEGTKPESPTDTTNLWLYYNSGKFYTDSAYTNEAKQVACDEKNPYHNLYAVWKAKDVNYTVEYYFQKTAGSTEYEKNETLKPTATRTAKTDTRVEVTADDKAAPSKKYVLNETKNEAWSATVAGNGSTVLKVYFDLNEADVTVHHYLKGTTTKVADDVTESKTIGTEYTAQPVKTYQEKDLTVDSYNPSQKVTVSDNGNEITIYYTLPLTITAKTDSKTYDGKPLNGAYTVTGALDSDATTINTALGAAPSITHVADGPKEYLTEADQAKITGIPGYYTVSYTAGKLTITPAPLTVVTDSAEKAYDGTALTAEGTVTGYVNNEKADFKTTGSQTAVGESNNTYTILFKGEEGATEAATAVRTDYDISETIGKLNVTDNTTKLEVKSSTNSWTYDGNAHTDPVYTVTYGDKSGTATLDAESGKYTYKLSTGDTITITPAEAATVTHVADGTKKNAFSYTLENAKNYSNVTKTEGELSITPATLTIKTESANKEYDGTALTADGSISGFVTPTGGEQETATFKVTGTQTEVGKSKNTYTLTWDGTAVETDYTLAETIGDLEVKKSTKELKVESADGEWTYDGDAHTNKTYTVTYGTETIKGTEGQTEFTLSTGDKVTVTPAATATITHVAESKVDNAFTWTVQNESFYTKGEDKVGKLTVTPVTLTIKTESAEKQYDGKPLTADGSVTGFVKNEAADFTVTGTRTEVGESANSYTIVFKGEEGATDKATAVRSDYTISETLGKLVVKQSEKELKIVSSTKTWEYDGTAHTDYVYTVTYGDEEYEVKVAEGAETAVATLSTGDKVTITPKATATITHVAETTVDNDYTYVVDNAAQFKTITAEKGKLSVTPAELTVTTESGSKVYDGKALTKPGTVTGFKNNENADFEVTGKQTKVGSSHNTYKIVFKGEEGATEKATAVKSDYKITEKLGTLTVTQGTTDVVITSSTKSWEYDGTAHTDPVYTVTYGEESGTAKAAEDGTYTYELSTGDVVTITPAAAATITHVAETTVDNAFTYVLANEEDYSKVTKTEGKLSVTPATLTITTGTATKVYDGEPLTAAGTITGFKNNETATFNVTGTITNAGGPVDNTYTLTWDGTAVESDYTLSESIGTLTVTKRQITYTSPDATKEYDGTALTTKAEDIQVDGEWVEGEGVDVTMTGTQTLVGSSSNTYTIKWKEGTNKDNYIFEQKYGTLTVTDGSDDKVVNKTDNSDQNYHVGDTVEWTVSVKNIYDEEKTLTVTEAEGMTIVSPDPLPEKLAAGAELEIKVEHVVTVEDIKAGKIKNTVTVKLGDIEKTGEDEVPTEPIEIEITADSDSRAYNGEALTKDSWKQTGGELAEGNKIDSVKVTGSQTLVGSSDNVPSDAKISDKDGKDVTEGYKITYKNGTLTVTDGKDEDVVKKTDNSDQNYHVGDTVEWTVSAKNIYDEEKTLTVTEAEGMTIVEPKPLPEKLAAGAELEIKVEHVVTVEDIKAGKINNTVKVKLGDIEKTGEDEVPTEPIKIEITADSDSKSYDGEALTNDGWKQTGGELAADNKIDSVKVTGSQTLVGSSDNVPSDAKISDKDGKDVTEGYDITYKNGTLTVTDKDVPDDKVVTKTDNSEDTYHLGDTVEWTVWAKNIYDEEKTLTVTETEGMTIVSPNPLPEKLAAGEEIEIKVEHVVTVEDIRAEKIKNTVKVKLGDLEKTGEDEVPTEPIEITIKANDAEKVYDGTPLTEEGFEVTKGTLAEDNKVDSVKVTGSQTDAGSSENVPSDAKIVDKDGKDVTNGYKITYTNGTLTVTPVTDEVVVTITGNKDEVTYDGTEQKVEGYEVSIDNELYTENDFAFSGEAVVKETNAADDPYPMGLAEDQFENISKNFTNVKFVVEDGELKINKRDLTITSPDDEKVYDGTPLTNHNYKVDGLADADKGKLTVEVTGSQTYVGSSPNEFQYKWDGEDNWTVAALETVKNYFVVYAAEEDTSVADNYNVTTVKGTLTVTDDVDDDQVIQKTHEGKKFKVGDVITFTITVKNIYDEPKTITIEEQDNVVIKGKSVFKNVAPGETVTTTAMHKVTAADVKAGKFKNTAKASFDGGKTFTGNDTVTGLVKTPGHGPDTGDHTGLMGLLGIFGASVAGFFAMLFRRRREQE